MGVVAFPTQSQQLPGWDGAGAPLSTRLTPSLDPAHLKPFACEQQSPAAPGEFTLVTSTGVWGH